MITSLASSQAGTAAPESPVIQVGKQGHQAVKSKVVKQGTDRWGFEHQQSDLNLCLQKDTF